ncbi:hypothetical protein EYF80_041086 [Liparis tanakae]|uniref:Uncharacterized protein n=1 Tax=Liparis tanakae TaxID=230148 RepID=A0A4Z2G590_9TELE|nr:hypothetical protein EYF80_041086 [Liparis tanakae]
MGWIIGTHLRFSTAISSHSFQRMTGWRRPDGHDLDGPHLAAHDQAAHPPVGALVLPPRQVAGPRHARLHDVVEGHARLAREGQRELPQDEVAVLHEHGEQHHLHVPALVVGLHLLGGVDARPLHAQRRLHAEAPPQLVEVQQAGARRLAVLPGVAALLEAGGVPRREVDERAPLQALGAVVDGEPVVQREAGEQTAAVQVAAQRRPAGVLDAPARRDGRVDHFVGHEDLSHCGVGVRRQRLRRFGELRRGPHLQGLRVPERFAPRLQVVCRPPVPEAFQGPGGPVRGQGLGVRASGSGPRGQGLGPLSPI